VTRAGRTWAAALVLVLSGHVAYATPSRLTAELRALDCCTNHCHHALPLAGANRCCGVDESGAQATVSRSTQLPPSRSLVAVAPAIAPAVAMDMALSRPLEPAGALSRAAPVFLLIRSLRL
jgi:hypothetical protein